MKITFTVNFLYHSTISYPIDRTYNIEDSSNRKPFNTIKYRKLSSNMHYGSGVKREDLCVVKY